MTDNQTGYFLLSLDTEIAWGHFDFDQLRRKKISEKGVRERKNVNQLLKLFNEFGIIGTWAVVGHLFYDKCEDCEVCPVLDWEGRYESFAEIYKTENRQWYASDLIADILASPVQQEIGFHGYTHRIFDESEMSPDEARVEAEEWLRAAAKWGIGPGAVVFPRNKIGHLPILNELAFVCFRGDEVVPVKWQAFVGGPFGSIFRKLTAYLATPAVYTPELDLSGLVNLPASRWMDPTHRLERFTGLHSLYNIRLERMIEAVKLAALEKKVVHLWLHPYEFTQDEEFERIRSLLSVVAELIDEGAVRSIGMAELARMVLPELQQSEDLQQAQDHS